MTSLTYAALVLAVAWIAWLIRVYRLVTRHRAEPIDLEQDEADRRRHALGRITRLEGLRQIQRSKE